MIDFRKLAEAVGQVVVIFASAGIFLGTLVAAEKLFGIIAAGIIGLGFIFLALTIAYYIRLLGESDEKQTDKADSK